MPKPNFGEPAQIIEAHGLDPHKLLRLLQHIYGPADDGECRFRVELRLNRYKIYLSEDVPTAEILSEAQISDCRAYRRRWA